MKIASEKVIAVTSLAFGMLLVIASVSQIAQTIRETNELEDITAQIDEIKTIKTDLEQFQVDFHKEYLNLIALDYEVSERLKEGLMNESSAKILLESQARQFWGIQDSFRNYFFEFNYGQEPDGKSKPWFVLKEQYEWLFSKDYDAMGQNWTYNETSGMMELTIVPVVIAIVRIIYIAPIDNIDYRTYYNISALDKFALNNNSFKYNQTAEIVFNQTWIEPLDIEISLGILDWKVTDLQYFVFELTYHLRELEISLVVNSVALLLLGFLIDLEGKRFWKMTYIIAAIVLTIYSLLGQSLLESLMGGGA